MRKNRAEEGGVGSLWVKTGGGEAREGLLTLEVLSYSKLAWPN